MKKFKITGMSCAACSSRVERAVSALDGVKSCSVNLLTATMVVDSDLSDGEIVSAVVGAGYGASPEDAETSKSGGADKKTASGEDREIRALIARLIASLIFLLPLVYLSMGHGMWGWRIPSTLENSPIAQGLCQLLLAATVMIINQKFFINGTKGLLHRAPNMDTLVSLGSGASFAYSVYSLFRMSALPTDEAESAFHLLHQLYFESAAMILTLITVGKLLEAISKGRTTNALRGLMELSPKTATIIRDGQETAIPAEKVKIDDIFVVRPGESIPVDGIVLEGVTAIDESALSGESLPADKVIGDKVSAGTINISGFIKCRATRVGADTTLSQIIKIVSDATATKAPISKVADRVSGVFVPVVLLISAITAVVWAIVGEGAGFIIARAISVLVISCPCALGLATPVAIMVGSGVGAKRGILFKTAEALEVCGKTTIAVLDKTGTVTKGEMTVTDVIPERGISEIELIALASSLEKQSEHPLAASILRYAEEKGASISEVITFKAIPGKGVTALLDCTPILGGNAAYISEKVAIPLSVSERASALAEEGKTVTYFAQGDRFLGIVAIADVIKEDSREAILEMKKMGIRVVMLTGDNEKTALAIGKQAEVDEVIADVLPQQKAEVVERLKKQGHVIMIGDGINDAPALVTADVGIAIGAGTDVAIDAADVVLMKSRLSDLPRAIKLSRATLRKIHQNLFWAFFYNIIGIPLAAGVWIPFTGWELNPMFGALAMSLSSFCVVTNALLLNLVRLESKRNNNKNISAEAIEPRVEDEGEKIMKKTMKITGMMCPHCSGRVKKCLEAIDGIESAEVSHESGTAIVSLTAPLSDEILKKTVEDQGYTVTGIE